MRVTGAFNDPLDRQIMERIQIQNFKGPVLMNRRSEMGGVRVDSELKVLAEIKFKCRGAFTCSQDKNRNHQKQVLPSDFERFGDCFMFDEIATPTLS